MRSQNGVISLFVLFAMLFLLVFCLCVYLGIKNRLGIQEYKTLEMQEIYSRSSVEETENAQTNELIPIYNINELNIAGTGSYLKINNKIYECGIGRAYILKDNIIVDIDEEIVTKRVGFNDYKIYSKTHYIDKNSNELYYYKDGSYWKVVAYQKFSKEENELVKNGIYLQNQFCNLDNMRNYGVKEFLIIWNDDSGMLSNMKKANQDTTEILSLTQINVFYESYNKIDKSKGEFYLFVNVGNNI